MRTFRHLTRSEISEIILSHHDGVSQAVLAERFSVDPSTVHYHVAKYERAYPEQGGVYALIKVNFKKTCVHPSSRCTLCSEMMDQLLRKERELIKKYKRALDDAHSLLRAQGFEVEKLDYNEENETT